MHLNCYFWWHGDHRPIYQLEIFLLTAIALFSADLWHLEKFWHANKNRPINIRASALFVTIYKTFFCVFVATVKELHVYFTARTFFSFSFFNIYLSLSISYTQTASSSQWKLCWSGQQSQASLCLIENMIDGMQMKTSHVDLISENVPVYFYRVLSSLIHNMTLSYQNFLINFVRTGSHNLLVPNRTGVCALPGLLSVWCVCFTMCFRDKNFFINKLLIVYIA